MPTRIFRSKINWWIVAFIVLIFGVEAWLFITIPAWAGLLILVMVGVPIISVFTKTRYTITDQNMLIVTCGFFLPTKIPIHDITAITKSSSLENSPALSLDRISVEYHIGFGKDHVILSPEDRHEFVAALKEINSNIDIKL
jgi:hypothetical protein